MDRLVYTHAYARRHIPILGLQSTAPLFPLTPLTIHTVFIVVSGSGLERHHFQPFVDLPGRGRLDGWGSDEPRPNNITLTTGALQICGRGSWQRCEPQGGRSDRWIGPDLQWVILDGFSVPWASQAWPWRFGALRKDGILLRPHWRPKWLSVTADEKRGGW